VNVDVVELLSDLVRTPSVNPMGREVSGDHYYEYAMSAYLTKLFDRLNVPHVLQEVSDGRTNVLAILEGKTPLDSGGKLMMWEAHQDTVPVDGMTIPPWTPDIKEGRLYGRGSCDIKGGMACMIAALARLVENPPANMPTIVMACTVNEEHGYTGASAIANLWKNGVEPNDPLYRFFPRTPDQVIVAEPTELNIVSAHKGVARWKCRTLGRAAHSSDPSLGDNAIYRMSRVLNVLENYANNVVGTLIDHPLVGRPTLSVGVISGGMSINTVPEWCDIQIDRRVLPGEKPMECRAHVIEHLAAALPEDAALIEHLDPMIMSGGLNDTDNDQLAKQLSAAATPHGGGKIMGVPFGTDATAYSEAGAPSVVFGPGSIAQAHTCDEWLDIEQLRTAADILVDFIEAI